MATYSTEDHERIGAAVRQDVRDVVEHKRLFEWAAECIRRLIEEIRLVPADGKLRVELYGELAALISLANQHPRSKGAGVQVTLVAGARSHLYRTRFFVQRDPRFG